MGVLSFLSGAIKPVTDLIDNLHTSDEEKGVIKTALTKAENAFATQVLTYEKQLLQMQTDIITAEAKGASWLQRSWRPITMLVFLMLVVADSFGWLANDLAPQAWTLLQIGLGGYVVGRSAEKVVPAVVSHLRKPKEG
jgi:hypothetical protein